jgi:serine/threonine protein kinase
MSAIPGIGDHVGDWILVERLGAGGMGVVYRAQHGQARREAAVKVLTGVDAADAHARMRNEARILKRLAHSNIATYIEYIDHHGLPCVAMRYVPGPTFAEIVRPGKGLPWQRALELFGEVVNAVSYLHAQGVLHRDLKPENIKLAPDGHAVLLDFGIAQDVRSASLTKVNNVIGTLGALAPEQLDGEPASTRTDVWALGVLLMHLLTGSGPFDATSATATRVKHRSGWRAAYTGQAIAPPLERILEGCLAIQPSRRLADAGAVASALSAPASTSGARQSIMAAIGHWAMWAQSRPSRSVIAVTVAILIAALGAGWWIARDPHLVSPSVTTADRLHAGGAKASTPPLSLADVLVDTPNGPAEVYSNGQPKGMTPYRARLAIGEKVHLELRRAGFTPQDVQFQVRPTDNRYDILLQRAP